MPCGTEAGSYLGLIDSCITQLKAQGYSRTCNGSKEEEEAVPASRAAKPAASQRRTCRARRTAGASARSAL